MGAAHTASFGLSGGRALHQGYFEASVPKSTTSVDASVHGAPPELAALCVPQVNAHSPDYVRRSFEGLGYRLDEALIGAPHTMLTSQSTVPCSALRCTARITALRVCATGAHQPAAQSDPGRGGPLGGQLCGPAAEAAAALPVRRDGQSGQVDNSVSGRGAFIASRRCACANTVL